MRFKNNHIILGILVLCCIVLSTTFYIGKKNNLESEVDFENYTYAVQKMQSNQSDKAIGILKQLDEKYPENIFIMRNLGLAFTSTGDPRTGASYFHECLELKPTLQLDVAFMFQYGEILLYNGDYEKAQVVLNKSLQLSSGGTYKKQIDNLLSKITTSHQISRVIE